MLFLVNDVFHCVLINKQRTVPSLVEVISGQYIRRRDLLQVAVGKTCAKPKRFHFVLGALFV